MSDTNPGLTFSTNQDELTFLPTENISLRIKKHSEEIMDFVCISLCKSFVNHASLNGWFVFIGENRGGFLFEMYEWILNHSKFISDIEIFELDFSYFFSGPKFDLQILLEPLLSITTSINTLMFIFIKGSRMQDI